MFEGLQSDYVVYIIPPDKVSSYETTLESFAIKDLYSFTLTSERGQDKVLFEDAFHVGSTTVQRPFAPRLPLFYLRSKYKYFLIIPEFQNF